MALESVGTAVDSSARVQQASLGQDDLLRIMLAQLSFQDPLKPVDNQEFMGQLAQFAGLEQTRQLNDKIDSILSMQSTNQAIGLLGRTVEVLSRDGFSIVGQVQTVNFSGGVPALSVKMPDGVIISDVGLAQISIIR